MGKVELAERCRAGDKKALDALYRHYLPQMRKVVARYVRNPDAAQDVVHDGFCTAFAAIGTLKDSTRLEAWLTAIMRNTSLQYLRKTAAEPNVALDESVMEQDIADPDLPSGEPVPQIAERTHRHMPLTIGLTFGKSLPHGWGLDTGVHYTFLRSDIVREDADFTRQATRRARPLPGDRAVQSLAPGAIIHSEAGTQRLPARKGDGRERASRQKMERKGKVLLSATLLLAATFAGASAQKENRMEAETAAKGDAAKPSGTLPVMHIDTENGAPVSSKTVYVAATFHIAPTAADPSAGLGSADAPLPLQIRGRGHSSWKGEKKPYKLKLGNAAPLLGMSRNRHWALLKPIESTVAGLRLAELTGMAWTPHYRPVEVVLNGDYVGLYFLAETIRIDESRVDIFRQPDLETDPGQVEGGWLVEVDNYHDECQITLPECSSWNLTLRYHSPERLSDVQRTWLTDEFTAINAAICSPDETSDEWEELVDARSMARFFILQEVMDNPDGFHGSFYLHKDLGEGARWVAGPAWDLACYNREKTDYTFRMKAHYGFTPHWIGRLIRRNGFCHAVREVWDEIYPGLEDALLAGIDAAMLPLADAWQCDVQRWGGDPAQSAQVRADRIKHALQRNIGWFAAHLPASPYASVPSPEVPASGCIRVHTLSGLYLGEYATEAEAEACLKGGIYLFNGKKVAVKPRRGHF